MNDLLSYVIESFFDSRQEKLNQLNTPEKLKSSDVVEYVRSNMKGSKTKQGAFLREGALYFLNAMAKEGGALDRGKPGTVAPGYAFEGGKREYGRVRGDSPLRKLQRPLIVPEVDYPGVPDSRLQDVVVAEALALFRAWSNRNKPRFFDYKLSKPMTGDSPEVEELMELYENHNRRFMRIHQLVAENNNTQPIYFDQKKGKLPIGTEGIQTGITITRPPQAMWICLKLRKKAGASWTMYTNSVAKLGSLLNRAGMPSMVSTYGKLWDVWTILPDEMSAPDAYDAIGAIDGISRVGRTTKGVAFRSFLMDSVLIDESTFSNNTSIFPLSLHIHHGESKVATLQEGEGNQDFTKDSGLSMIPATGTLAQFDVGIDNHPLQAMYNAPDLVARVYRFARTAQIIPQLQTALPTIEIDSDPSNQARDYWTSIKQMDGGDFYEGELKQIPPGRDITIEFDGEKAYLTGFPNDRKLTNLIQTEEFEQLCDKPATAFARISGKDANALATFISQLDPSDFDEKRVKEAFQDRILTIWGLSCTLGGEFEPFAPISDVSGRFIRATKQAKPDDVEEMLAVSPEGLIGTVEPSEDRKEEKLIFGERTTPVVVLGYEKASVQNQEARVIIVGKVVEEVVDILVPGVRKPTRKAGKERREQYQEVARVGAFSGFNYDDRKDLLSYMESLNYQTEHDGDILIDPVEANIIFEMSYKGLLADKQMWRYNRTGKSKEVGVKQDLPAGGERFVQGVKTRFIMEPKEKNAIAQYNNPKIIGYRSEMGREEQRIYPMLIPSSDVTYGVALKSNPPIALSKYTNFVEKENSPLIAALGFTNEKFAKEDLGEFRSRMKEKHGTSTAVVQSGKTLVAHKKGAKLGELCDNCSAPKAFSPPAEIRQERAADEGPSITFICEVCGRQSYQRDRRNPLVSVEETGGDMKLATKLLRYMEYDLSDEVKPFLHTNWPSWYRRSERDLIVRGLERFDYTGVIEGLVNKTGSTYYNTLFNIAKRNNGGPLIKNRVQHQELAMLYSLCHNDLELIVAWPNATSSGKIDDFEKELEANGTIVYQKEVRLPRNGAEVLCMQMYAGESFLSKKQCQRKALASGWERTDKAMGAGRKLRVYLYYNDSENSLRGKAAKRKEELRSLFKTSDSDRKSYIHTADNAVQVTEYAQVFFNDNSINLLNNNDLDMLLPEKPYKTWLMMNSVKKYIQQELGSLFLLSSQIKSGSAAYLHGIRRTEDIDMMIDDRRLGPEVKQKMEAMKELMPWTDSSLAYSARDNEAKFWNFETYVPGKTFYEKRSEMIHNPKYHAYFCGLKVENAEAFLYMRMSRIAGDARPRPVADMLMLNEFMEEGRFKELKSKYKLIVPVGTLRKTVANRFYDKGGLQGWYKTVRYFIQERYKRKYTIEEIRDMLNAARTKTKPNPLDTDAIEERLLADVEGSFTDEAETRRNPGGATVVITVPHALHAGPDVEEHWCDWSAAPAGRQIDKIMSKDHKTILHLADEKRTEIDYNRVVSADTKWQYRLDDYIEEAGMLLDIHSFPPDDVMWAGYDFVLFNSSEWPQQRQMEQAKLQDHLVKKGYKVFMDIADHRNYIQEKGIKAGIPSFLIEFNEELPLKDSCEDLIEGLEELLPKSNPVLPMKRHGWFPKSAYITEVPGEEEMHNEIQAHQKKHDALVQSIMKKDFSKTWTWNRPVAEAKKEAEMKALKKAKKKADKELGDFKVCRRDCLYCSIEQNKTNPTPHFFPGDAVIKYPWLKYADLIKTNPPRPVPKFGYHFTHEKNLKKIKKHGLWEDFNYLFYPDALYHAWVVGGHIDGMYDTPSSTRQPTQEEVLNALTKMVMLKVKVEPEQYRPVPYETGKLHDEFILEGNVSPSNIEVLGSVMETVLEDFKTNKVTMADVQEWAMGNNAPDPTKIIDGTFYNLLGHVKWYDEWKKSKHPKIIERLKENPSKDLYDVFEEWCSLVNMTNKELETFLNSNWGKVAGLSKQEAKNWNDIKSGRVSGRRILKMRKKIGFSGPNDQIKSQIDIGKAWEKALKNWTGPSGDSMKGETDWDWCKRQVRFNKRAGAFPYNQNAEERKGALVKKQKTQNQPSRRLLSLWVWGHDPWRWAYDNDVARMPKCPDTAWVGNKEKRKYGKIEVIAGPKKNLMMSLPYLYSQILRGVVYSEEGLVPKENPPIFPEPERISKVKGGRYKMDSGQDVSGLHFNDAVILGSDKSINVEWKNQEEEPEPKPAPKSGLRRIRFNMLRPSKFDGYKDAWIVASETSKGHIYSLSVEVQTTLTLKTFPGKKSEPRLRPETYGSLHPLNKIGEITIKSSGKKHPLYDRVFVMDSKENKKQPKNFHKKRARERSGAGRCVCGKISYSSPQKAHAAASKEGRGVHPCEIKKGVWHTTSSRRNPIDPEYLKELNEELEDDYQDWTEELVPVPEMVELGYGVETHPYMHKTKSIPDPTNDPDFSLKAKEAEKRSLEDSMFDEETADGDWERTLSASEGRAQKILGLDEDFTDDYGRQMDYQTGEMRTPKTIEERIVRDEQEELAFLDGIIQQYTEDPDEVPVFHPDFQKDLVRRNKGGGTSERLYRITKRYVRTLHPQTEPFTSRTLVERLKNRKVKQVESRQLGRVLSRLAREGQLVREIDNTYRNTQKNYQEYLDEQEEPKANPRTKKGRKVPTRYLKGLNKTEMEIAKYEIDRGYEYDIDDPEAYEDWKSDIMAKARGMKTAPSRFKMKFIKKYGPLPEGKDLVSRIAKATGIKKKYIQKAYSKGLAAWRGGHRPGTSQHQWASGRAYALVMGAPTSTGKGKPDFKLAVEAGVRDEKGKLLI